MSTQETVVDRLKAAFGATSLDELADRMGEKRSTVGSWSARGKVPLRALLRASEIAKCSVDFLLTGRDESHNATPAVVLEAKSVPADKRSGYEQAALYARSLAYTQGDREMRFVLVPRFDARASAGPGQDNGHATEKPVGEIAFESDWMRANFGRAGTGFALVDVAGNSMEPTLWDGETVVVDLLSRDVVSGGVYLLRDGDELLVKRLQRLIGGKIEVVSDNPSYRSQVVPQADELGIVGRVVWPRVR